MIIAMDHSAHAFVVKAPSLYDCCRLARAQLQAYKYTWDHEYFIYRFIVEYSQISSPSIPEIIIAVSIMIAFSPYIIFRNKNYTAMRIIQHTLYMELCTLSPGEAASNKYNSHS